MKLWQVQSQDLREVKGSALDDEQRLEDWIAKDPDILGMDVLLIGRQVTTAYGGRIDLLAMDSEANLVVLELKRDKTPREIVAQTLDYASWIRELSYEQIDALAQKFTKKSLPELFTERFSIPLPETVNASHSLIILASQLDDSSERIVQYLSEQYGVPINALFFKFFRSESGEFLGRAWLKDPEEMQERTQAKKKAPWSGYYFVNVGEGQHRNWDDCRTHSFLSAGQGEKYGPAMKKLNPGDLVFAYLKGTGYVGFGRVTSNACMVRDFTPHGTETKLLDLPLKQPNMAVNKDDPTLSEWVVAIEWLLTFDRDKAKRFPGIFANQNIVCQLRDQATVDFLRSEFGIQ